VLAISLEYTYASLSSENQQINSKLTALNQSYNANLTNMSDQINKLRSLLANTLGLNFSMTLNTMVLDSGETISITLDEWNLLDSFNNVTASNNWTYSDFQGYACSVSSPALPNMPFGIAIIQGYYSEANLTDATSLPLFSPPGADYFCAAVEYPPSEFDFYPLSNNVIEQSPNNELGNNTPIITNEVATQTLNFSGYLAPYNGNGTTQTINFTTRTIYFTPGVYTVVGGDEWGQLVILHFEVT